MKYPFYDQGFRELVSCYERFSLRTGCPIYVNLLEYGKDGFVNGGLGNEGFSLEELRNFLLQIFSNSSVYKNIVLINPVFKLQRQI